MDVILSLFIILLVGLLFGKIATYLRLPDVVGYLLAGIVIGPCVLHFISFEQIDNLETFSTIALSFISFSIGAEFKFKFLKRLGLKTFVIAIMASFCALILVTSSFLLLGYSFSFSLILGAIASSTAPAAIMMVVKQYHAKGDLTSTMLSVIAIDDIISIVIFGFAFSISQYLNASSVSLLSLLNPFKEIILSVIIGSAAGFLLGFISRLLKNKSEIVSLIIASIFGVIVMSDFCDMSPLLVCMVMGIIFINLYPYRVTEKILDLIDYISPPILIIFFVLSGADLDFRLLPDIATAAGIYLLMRTIGKIFGAMLGAKLVHSSSKVCRYLGPTLLSQTGLAIGLAILALPILPNGQTLIAIVIASSLVFDLLGPIITKIILLKTGEAKLKKQVPLKD